MSIHSTQSERPQRRPQLQPRHLPSYQASSLDPAPEEEMEYLQVILPFFLAPPSLS